jgi:heme oxygenase
MVGTSPRRVSGVTVAALRRATAADHESVDALIDQDRLIEIEYYAAVARGLIESAEIVEGALPRIPRDMCREGLSPVDVSKRVAIDAESSFLDGLMGPQPVRRLSGEDARLAVSGPLDRGTVLGLLYVYVGSALGGLHLLRVARTAPWWKHERTHVLLRPYGHHLNDRWQAVLNALEHLDQDETHAAVMAARACFAVYRRSLVDHLSVGGDT